MNDELRNYGNGFFHKHTRSSRLTAGFPFSFTCFFVPKSISINQGKMPEKPNNLIKFNISKNEIFQLTENYKTVHRKLKMTFKVEL